MKKLNLSGTGVALVTPFDRNGKIDFEALTRLVEHVTENGVDYLVVLGTTAETPTLGNEEKREIVSHVIGVNKRRLPVIVGFGGNNTSDLITRLAGFDFDGIDGILSVTPYYNKPSQRGLYEHFKAVADASPVPVVLYNVPGRTGVNMTAQTTLSLASHPNIVAVKEASGNLSQASYILRDRPEGFFVLSGDDNLTFPMMALGADGVISVSANCFTATMTEMVNLLRKGNVEKARPCQMRLIEATDALFEEGNPTGVKAALAIKKIAENNLRLPLVPASEALWKKLEGLITTNRL